MTEAVKVALIVAAGPVIIQIVRTITTFFHRRWQRGEQAKEHAAHAAIGDKVDGLRVQLNGGLAKLIEQAVERHFEDKQ